jgi:sugar lactone lactonase YvrE
MPWFSFLNAYNTILSSSNDVSVALSNASNALTYAYSNAGSPGVLNKTWEQVNKLPIYIPSQTAAIVNSCNAYSIKSDNTNLYVSGIYSNIPTIYNNNAIISQTTLNPTNSNAVYLIKYNTNMQALSAVSIDNVTLCNTSIALDTNSNIILACTYSNPPKIYNSNATSNTNLPTIPTTTDSAALITKYDSNLNASWATCVNHAIATSVTADANSNIILAGTSLSNVQPVTYDIVNTTVSAPYTLSAYTQVTTVAGSGTGTFLDGTGTLAGFNSSMGVTVDSSGNIYVADADNNRIRKISPIGQVTTIAGSGIATYLDGVGTAAGFNTPSGIILDINGNLYIADTNNHRIRKISTTGQVTTIAGSGIATFLNGTGTLAGFNSPQSITVDNSGILYIADTMNYRVRKITTDGIVTTLVGTGSVGSFDSTGTSASFNKIYGITISTITGIIYVNDTDNQKIRKITQAGVVTSLSATGFSYPRGIIIDKLGNIYVCEFTGRIKLVTSETTSTTIAGSVTNAYLDATGINASFWFPSGIALDTYGNIYVADPGNNRIRRIEMLGVQVNTLAGSGTATYLDGIGAYAGFNNPFSIVFDSSYNIYISDSLNNRIRKITKSGIVTTFAGSGLATYLDGNGTLAGFNNPAGLIFDNSGNLYVADTNNNRIRKITQSGVVTTFAGSGVATYLDGTGTAAGFNLLQSLTIDSSNNLYVADTTNHRIRKITSLGQVTTFAGSGTGTFLDGTGTAAGFFNPRGITINTTSGILYIADTDNYRIRQISITGQVTTIAGSGVGTFSDGLGTTASFKYPFGICVDLSGSLIVTDTFNNRVRKIVNNLVTTIAGSGTQSYLDGSGPVANFNGPCGLAIDNSGTLYVSDLWGHRIRVLSSPYIATTIAGSGVATFLDGTGIAAGFNKTAKITIDVNNNLYVADQVNHRIRKITNTGIVSTIAGSGLATYLDSTGTLAGFNNPDGIIIDSNNNLYVCDTGNNRIRKITPVGVVTTLAGSGVATYFDGTGTAAGFNTPRGITIDSNNNIYICDFTNNRIRKITNIGQVTTIAGTGNATYLDGIGTAAGFNNPMDITIDSNNNMYVIDYSNNRLRKINTSGQVTTLAGSGTSTMIDGTGTGASFSWMYAITIDSIGTVYVANYNYIRKVTSAGIVTTIAGAAGNTFADGIGTMSNFLNIVGLTTDKLGNIYISDKDNNRIRKLTPASTSSLINTISASSTVTLPTPSSISSLAVKYDNTGKSQWSLTITPSICSDVITDVFNNIYLVGSLGSNAASVYQNTTLATGLNNLGAVTGTTAFALKANSNGQVQWLTKVDGTGTEQALSAVTDSSGNLYMTGSYYSTNATLYNSNATTQFTLPSPSNISTFLAKYSPTGIAQWVTSIMQTSTTGSNNSTTLAIDSSNNIYLAGSYSGCNQIRDSSNNNSIFTLPSSLSTTSAYIIKYDSNGIPQAVASTNTNINSIIADSSNIYVVGCYTSNIILYDGDNLTFNNLILPSVSNQTALITKYTLQNSSIYLQCSPYNINGKQKYITNVGSNPINISILSNTSILSSLNLKPYSTAPYIWYNDYWYYMGTDLLRGPVTVNPYNTTATLNWAKSANVAYSIVTLPGGSNTGQITNSYYDISSLTSNTSYTYTVTPYNVLGTSNTPQTITFTTNKVASISQSLSYTNVQSTTARIIWSNLVDTSYVILTWPPNNISSQQTGLYYDVDNLSPNVSNTLTVTPYNNVNIAGIPASIILTTLPLVLSIGYSTITVNTATIIWTAAANYVIVTWPTGNISGQIYNSQYIATGLTDNTSYTFTVTPYNVNNIAGISMSKSLVTLASITLASTLNILTTSLNISWTGAFSYVVITWPTGNTSGNQTVSPYSITNLTVNTSYTFTVTPYNINNIAGPAVTTTTITQPTITSASNSSILMTSAVISWTGLVGSYVIITWSGGSSGNQTMSSYTATGLTAGTAYTFTVTPYNANNLAGTHVTTSLTTQVLATLGSANTSSTTSNSTSISWSGGTNVQYVIITWPSGNTSSNLLTSPYTASSLSANTSYTFTLTPYNAGGLAGTPITTNITTLGTVLSASNSSITATSASISWSSLVGSYVRITWPTGNTSGNQTVSPYSVTNLTAITNYTFTVTPYNSAGVGGTAVTTTLLTGPAITSASTSSITTTGLTVSWTGLLGSYVIITWPTGNTSGNQTAPYSVTGLIANTSYTFTVTPYNVNNLAGTAVTTTTITQPTITSASNTNVLVVTASISWIGLVGSYVIITWSGGSSGNQTVSPYSVINLSGSTAYTFTVTPYNANNLAGSPVTTNLTTQPLATLGSTSSSSITTNSVLISWSGATNTSYVILSWSGGGPSGNSGNQSGSSYSVTGLSIYTYYTITLTPYNSYGTVGTVRSISLTTLDGTPALVSNITNVSMSSSIILSWSYNSYFSYVNITWSGGNSGNISGSSYTASGLSESTNYTFTFTPYNHNGLVGTVTNLSLTTPAAPPQPWLCFEAINFNGNTYIWGNTGTLGATHHATSYNYPYKSGDANGYYVQFNRNSSQYCSLPQLNWSEFQSPTNIYYANWGYTFVIVGSFLDSGAGWERFFDFGNGAPNYNIIMGRSGNNISNAFVSIYNSSTLVGQLEDSYTATDTNTHIWIGRLYNYSHQGVAEFIYDSGSSTSSKYFSMSMPYIYNRSTTQNYIGRSNWSSDPYLSAKIREIRVYNTALPDSTCIAVYNELRIKWGL